MTKRIYKTAKELKIRESEKKALLKFAKFIQGLEPDERVKIPGDGMFRFEMAAVSEPDYNTDKYNEITNGGFDLDDKDNKMLHRECGTAVPHSRRRSFVGDKRAQEEEPVWEEQDFS